MQNIIELKIEETKAVVGGNKASATAVTTAAHVPATAGTVPLAVGGNPSEASLR
jgi:hypothetical protein